MSSKDDKYEMRNETEQALTLLEVPQVQLSKTEPVKKRNFYGILFALMAAFCFSMANILVKSANFFSGIDIGFFRYTIQLTTMLGIGLYTKTNLIGNKDVRKDLIFTGFFFSLTVLLIFFSLKMINPSESSAFFQCNMIAVPIIARFYLKEKFNITNLLSLIMAIVGVFFISQPPFLFKPKLDLNTINNSDIQLFNGTSINVNEDKSLNKILGTTSGLLSALFYAFAIILSKNVANKKVHFSVPIIYQAYIGIPMSIAISIIFFFTGFQKYNMKLVSSPLSIIYQIGFAIGSGVFSVLLQIFLNIALRYEKSTLVSIIFSTSLLFTFLFQYLFLNINSNLFSTLGALLIFVATLLIIVFQMLEKKLLSDKKNQNETKDRDEISIPVWKKCLFFKI